MQERNAGREMVVTVLELHWENEKKKKKNRGECIFVPRCYLNVWN